MLKLLSQVIQSSLGRAPPTDLNVLTLNYVGILNLLCELSRFRKCSISQLSKLNMFNLHKSAELF